MIDTLHIVETPEGVELELPVAGPVSRLLAWLIDSAIQALGLGLLVLVLSAASSADEGFAGLLFISIFAVLWFYGVAFEVLNHGRTPGKLALGIQVVRDDGTPVGLGASILRNFLRGADWLPYGYTLGFLCMSIDGSFRRLGDLAAGTLVVYDTREGAAPPEATAEPKPPPVALELDERRAVIAFAARAHLLSSSRAEELASTAVPLLEPGQRGQARRRIGQIAAWLVGASEPSAAPVGAGVRPGSVSASQHTPAAGAGPGSTT